MNIFWFRRDLRIIDNHALSKSLYNNITQTIFIFDNNILNKLKNKQDSRVEYIYNSLYQINLFLKKQYNSSIKIYQGDVLICWKKIIYDFKNIKNVFINEDYEPYSKKRDYKISLYLSSIGIKLYSFKDHVIFGPKEILKKDRSPYLIYTPYAKEWKKKIKTTKINFYKVINNFNTSNFDFPHLNSLNFFYSKINIPKININKNLIKNYTINRNFPFLMGTSNLGIYLRFGTISIRQIISNNYIFNNSFINQLIWREFFIQILFYFPKNEKKSFKEKYNNIIWENKSKYIENWKSGKTGFPLIDAGMIELNKTGLMHNRVRMLCANFLVKYLLVDWKIGEKYFAEKLLDFDLASNNGNWQWSAGSGCDAVPYFRLFNPILQQKKFDSNFLYIKKWIPNFSYSSYICPIIDLKLFKYKSLVFFKNYFSKNKKSNEI